MAMLNVLVAPGATAAVSGLETLPQRPEGVSCVFRCRPEAAQVCVPVF